MNPDRETTEVDPQPSQEHTDQRTMADRMAGRIGTVRSGRGDLSERARELYIKGLLKKKRAGRL